MADSRGHRERARSAETYIHDDSQSTLLIIDLYEKSGTAGTRTQDQSLKRALLYQLSYRPNQARMIAELCNQITENARKRTESDQGVAQLRTQLPASGRNHTWRTRCRRGRLGSTTPS